MNRGKLFLIPCPIADDNTSSISEEVRNVIKGIKHYIVENARTSRRFIRQLLPEISIQEMEFLEMEKHSVQIDLGKIFAAIEMGRDIGLMSEAGNPCIADPGNTFVSYAHRNGIEVLPIAGPNSIIMALIASGFNGQNFTFHGYLPNKKPELSKRLKQLEIEMMRSNYTHIFMETPYRNEFLIQTLCESLQNDTLLSISMDLGSGGAQSKTLPIKEWKRVLTNSYNKKPCVYLIGRW